MFDNLRESADSSFYEEEPNDLYKEPAPVAAAPAKAKAAYAAPRQARRSTSRTLGMTAPQRFFLTLMIFLTVCMMGTLAMFMLGKMSLF